MTKTIEITELAIVIATNADSTLLNPSFLTGSGIVPTNWELARQPVVSQRASQIIYNNGVNLIAQPNRLTLLETLKTSEEQPIETPAIASRFVQTLPHLDYQAVGINFRGYIPFPASPSDARDHLFKTLLASGPWLSIDGAKVQAGLNFIYTFSNNRLNLSINEAALSLPSEQQVPIILFSGNFDYDLSEVNAPERHLHLQSLIKNWRNDLEIYTSVVNQFLSTQTETESLILFPAPTV